MSPSIIRDKIGDLANEDYFPNPIDSLKQQLSIVK